MKKIVLVIHGPNLNLLGRRDQYHYGKLTLTELTKIIRRQAKKIGFGVRAFQSNHEGALIDWIQKNSAGAAGIIINPGAFTHYSYALHDALLDSGVPCIEVHFSDVNNREPWRKISVTAPVCKAVFSGKKEQSYLEGLKFLYNNCQEL